MKKGLSVLLIVAALFGFYGGAANLNDVLACKGYWEDKSEETTANLNKLEDGINQLKENEGAYLDGKEALPEGEKTLAEGEQALADGKAQLAESEQAFAEAPGKLADGKAQLDEKKSSYEAGKAFKKIVDSAAAGLSNKAAYKTLTGLLAQAGVSGAPASYKEMDNTLDSLKQLKAGTDQIAGMNSEQAFRLAVSTQDAATQKKLADAGVTSYANLKGAIAQAEAGLDSLKQVRSMTDTFTGKTEDQLHEIFVGMSDDLKAAGITDYKTLAEKQIGLTTGKKQIDQVADAVKDMSVEQKKEFFVGMSDDLKAAGITSYAQLEATEKKLSDGKAQIDQVAGLSDADLKDFLVSQSDDLKAAGINDYATLAGTLSKLTAGKATIDKLASDIDALKDYIVANNDTLSGQGITSYSALKGKISDLEGAKNKIDGVAGMQEGELQNFLVKENSQLDKAGITSYAALEAAIDAATEAGDEQTADALKTAKQTIDALVADRKALRDALVGQSEELEKAGITSFAALEGAITALKGAQDQVDTNAEAISERDDEEDFLVSQNEELKAAGITTYAQLEATEKKLSDGKAQIDGLAGLDKNTLKDTLVKQNADLKAAGINDYATLAAKAAALTAGKAQVDTLSSLDNATLKDVLVGQSEELAAAGINNYAALEATEKKLSEGKATVDQGSAYLAGADSNKALGFVFSQLDSSQQAALKAQGVDGTSYAALNAVIKGVEDTKKDLQTLKAGTDAVTNMSKEAAFKTAVSTQDKATQDKLKNSGVTSYKALNSTIDSLAMLDNFTDTLSSQKGNSKSATYKNIINTLKGAGYGSMISALPGSYDDLAALLKQYEDGVKTYTESLAAYKAAPAKLEEGRAKLADAEQQLAEGKQTLADGKAKLAEYEEGEDTLRDGLATLMHTEPDGDLVSILDRRNGDDNFDDANHHVMLDEALGAVEIGREFQGDTGEAVTAELTGRTVGAITGFVAAALAILAAILSFLKKNKGAGVTAILAAVAGAAALVLGSNAGMTFSSVAGSAVGATPAIACGVLAAVALVDAIVHFTSKNA